MSAAELLKEFQTTGQQWPFEEIVRRYAGMVFHVCLKVTKNTHDAEDATQAVFLTLAVQAKTSREIRYIGPWLQQVAHRVALDMRKSKNRRQLREEQHGEITRMRGDAATNGNGAHALDVQELNGAVGEELNKLPPKYRLPLILHYYGGMSREAMAKELNCKPATLGVRLHRGREMLGNRLAERGVVLAEGMLAAGLVCYIHSSVTDSMVAATCRAATSLVAGRDLHAGLVSAQVVSVAKNAVRAVLLAKLKLAAVVALAAGTALAAGAEVVAKLPIDLRLNLKISRLLRPLLEPLLRPSYSQAPQTPTSGETNLALGDQPVLSPVAVGAWSAFSAGAVEGTAPVFIPQAAARETAPAAAASRSAVVSIGPLEGQEQWRASGGISRAIPAPGASTMVLAGQPIPTANNKSAGIDHAASPLMFSSPPPMPARPHDSTAPFPATSAPRYSPLAFPTLVPLAGNVPIGPYPATASITLPPPPQPNNPTRASTAILNSTSSLASSTPTANRTIYLNQVAPPVPAGPASPGVTMLAAAPDTAANTVQPQSFSISYNVNTAAVAAFTDSATTMTQSQPVIAAAYEPRMLAQISGTTLSASSDTLQGWGAVGPADTFDQNGRVIADGQGTPHTLDLSQVASVRNSVDNPTTSGTNGWFAQNGGKLLWPPLQVTAGAGSYTVGEDPADVGLDLVNSVRLNVKNAARPARVSVALLSTDRPDYPPLPTTDHVLDVWQIDSTDPSLGRIGVTMRYDDAAVSKLSVSESRLKLWQFNNGWDPVADSFILDTSRKMIGGDVDSPAFLALAGPDVGATDMSQALPGDAGNVRSGGLLTMMAPQTMVVVPEPTALLTIATAAAWLLSRRRSRRPISACDHLP